MPSLKQRFVKLHRAIIKENGWMFAPFFAHEHNATELGQPRPKFYARHPSLISCTQTRYLSALDQRVCSL